VGLFRGALEAAEKRVIAVRFMEKHASAAKADFDLIGFIGTTESRALSKRRLRLSFSAACEAQVFECLWRHH
jgi:hypothetical protein